MKKVWRVGGGALSLFAVFILAGCQAVPVSNGNTAATTVATPSPVTTPSPAANMGANNLPVTLPVLDAMFADEKFAADLKSQLQLTDEQIERLRKVAREETGSLRETESGEHNGTTSAATARAAEQIKSVLGDERAARFSEFVSARWSGGGNEGGAGGTTAGAVGGGKPNAVPADTRIVVNAPAYRMDVFENGQLVKTYKIGIGYPEFPLPVGMRRANSIIYNPTWTPPDEPWVESPSSKVKVGERVAAGSPLNPLGPIKIPIGLPSLIHGGKSQAKLGGFASHGCVGLTNAQVQDVARLMAKLGGAEVTDEDVAGYAKNRTVTKDVKLERPLAVELRYETIVVEDGKLHIYRDVYDRDTNTEENLRAVLTAYGVSLDSLSEPERARVLDALKQMARDATGKPADGTPDASPEAANKNANQNANNKNANKSADAESRKVTRAVKGQKEIVIEIAALKGKGYPAPVAMDAGSGAGKPAAEKKGKRS